MNKFIIFSEGRCGSTWLNNVINTSTGVNSLEEPFWSKQKNKGNSFFDFNNKRYNFDELFRCLCNNDSSFKHVFTPFHDDLNKTILEHPDYKIIFLVRENILLQCLSWYCAIKTKTWSAKIKKKENYEEAVSNIVLDFKWFEEKILEIQRKRSEYMRHCLSITYGKVFHSSYESLFEGDGIEQISSFLDVNLDTKKTDIIKLNNVEAYRKIKGIEELQKEFIQYGSIK